MNKYWPDLLRVLNVCSIISSYGFVLVVGNRHYARTIGQLNGSGRLRMGQDWPSAQYVHRAGIRGRQLSKLILESKLNACFSSGVSYHRSLPIVDHLGEVIRSNSGGKFFRKPSVKSKSVNGLPSRPGYVLTGCIECINKFGSEKIFLTINLIVFSFINFRSWQPQFPSLCFFGILT